MKRLIPYSLTLISLLAVGCHKSDQNKNDDVVSQRYVHRYGYDVSKEEWESTQYPGQVITTLRNGVTINASYEDGALHGKTTHTFPHSQTVESQSTFEKGKLSKKVFYNIRGIPQREESYLGANHVKLTRWYGNGTPMSQEEFKGSQLLEAEYYNKNNEVQFKVSSGSGIKITRDSYDQIMTKETMENGYPIRRETFHPHGIPHTVIDLTGNFIDGEKKVFAPSGEPISIETYKRDVLNGPATYYQNGCRYLELNYKNGQKHGTECHYVDGDTVVEETEWLDGQKHGPSVVYFDSMSKTQWYYNNTLVSKEKFRELSEQEENIAIMNERTH